MLRMLRLWGLALAIGTAGVIAACATDTAAPAVPETSQLLTDIRASGLVRCDVLPYASSSALIGPEGGVLSAGKHRLSIPAGALDRAVLITMEAPSDTISSVRFSPEGLTFDPSQKPKLQMDYSHCSLVSLLPKKIVYVDEQLTVLEKLVSLDILRLFKVETSLDHFSRYAVAY